MIIISESSADVTQPVRMGRHTAACSRSSAAHDDTQKYTDARPISVHTEEVTKSKYQPAHRAPLAREHKARRIIDAT